MNIFLVFIQFCCQPSTNLAQSCTPELILTCGRILTVNYKTRLLDGRNTNIYLTRNSHVRVFTSSHIPLTRNPGGARLGSKSGPDCHQMRQIWDILRSVRQNVLKFDFVKSPQFVKFCPILTHFWHKFDIPASPATYQELIPRVITQAGTIYWRIYT